MRFQSFAGETIDMRRGRATAMENNISPTQIIGQDDNHIRPSRGRLGEGGERGREPPALPHTTGP